ncbi:MAG: MMPL family transporter [Streptosporangiaceae bacterium]
MPLTRVTVLVAADNPRRLWNRLLHGLAAPSRLVGLFASLREEWPAHAADAGRPAGTVTCAMLCLLAADSASLHGLGPVGAVGIVSALIAQTTFLPALLLVTERGTFWPRMPRFGASGREESRIWRASARRLPGGRLRPLSSCSSCSARRAPVWPR